MFVLVIIIISNLSVHHNDFNCTRQELTCSTTASGTETFWRSAAVWVSAFRTTWRLSVFWSAVSLVVVMTAVRLLITVPMLSAVMLTYKIPIQHKSTSKTRFHECAYNNIHGYIDCFSVSLLHILKHIQLSTGNGPTVFHWWSCQGVSGYTEPCHYHIWWPIEASCACVTVDFSLIPLKDPSHPFISPLKVTEPINWIKDYMYIINYSLLMIPCLLLRMQHL